MTALLIIAGAWLAVSVLAGLVVARWMRRPAPASQPSREAVAAARARAARDRRQWQ